MTSFSSLLSSIGDKPQAPQSSNTHTTTQKAANGADRYRLTPNNAAAGQKRKSEDPEIAPRQKLVKIEQQNGVPSRPIATAAGPSSRFQLSAKPNTSAKPAMPSSQRSIPAAAASSNPQRSVPKPVPKPQGSTNTPTPPGTADGTGKAKKGFASILEKAKAAQEAAKASAAVGGITHKPAEKMTRKERLRMLEESKAQQKAGRKALADRSRSGTPAGPASKAGMPQKKVAQGISYKGTMKKAPEPINYKGTMRAVDPAAKAQPKKGMAQDKYGGYASWSDLSDAEDEDERYYDSESDDMEAGIDDVEAEEAAALRLAKKEDQEAMEEEARLAREKLERKRKLQALNRSAALKKKY